MSMCSGNPLVCDCEMKWYKKWWEGDWQKIDTDHIKVDNDNDQKYQGGGKKRKKMKTISRWGK